MIPFVSGNSLGNPFQRWLVEHLVCLACFSLVHEIKSHRYLNSVFTGSCMCEQPAVALFMHLSRVSKEHGPACSLRARLFGLGLDWDPGCATCPTVGVMWLFLCLGAQLYSLCAVNTDALNKSLALKIPKLVACDAPWQCVGSQFVVAACLVETKFHGLSHSFNYY